MGGTNGESSAQTAGGTGGVTELPSGRVASSHGITPKLVETAFQIAQELSDNPGAVTPGAEPADETNPLKSAGIEFAQEQPPTQEETNISTKSSPTEPSAHIEGEQRAESPDPDLESMLETERQQKTQETQEAWVNLINAMKECPVPFFATSASKEMLFLIKPTRDPSNPNSKIYVVITTDGPKAIQATKEAKEMINKLYLNPTEDPVANKLEALEMSPLLINETLDPVSPVMKESQEMAAKIGEKRKEINELETSKNLAEKLKGFLNPQQTAPISS